MAPHFLQLFIAEIACYKLEKGKYCTKTASLKKNFYFCKKYLGWPKI